MLSPHSSVPSTAVSSPHLRPHSGMQGGLDVPAMSILRRDSISSDGEGLHVSQPQVQVQVQVDSRPDVSGFVVSVMLPEGDILILGC
jgi:hypothetical protein